MSQCGFFQKLLKKTSLLFICLLATTVFCPADGETISFDTLSVSNGLSQNTCNCVLQDRIGFIWIGTEDGLNRFDGYGFKVFRPISNNPDSLSNNSIWALCLDRNNDLWVGTYNGLNRINRKTELITRFLPDPKNPHSLSYKHVKTIMEDKSGTIWVGTLGGGLCRFNSQKQDFTVFRHDAADPTSISDNSVQTIFQDNAGRFWIGTNHGLNLLDPLKGTFSRQFPNLPLSLSSKMIQAIYQDRGNFIWVGTNDGLYRIDMAGGPADLYKFDSRNPATISSNDIKTILADRSGTIWIGTGEGLNIFDRRQNHFTRILNNLDDQRSLSGNEVRSLMEDNTGTIWVGTFANGLCRYEKEIKKFHLYKRTPNVRNTLSVSQILSIYQDRQNIIWVGTFGGGLNRFDRDKNLFSVYKHNPDDPTSLSHDQVRAIFEDSRGYYWIGTYGGGLDRFDPQRGTFFHYRHDPRNPHSLCHDQIRSISEDREGFLWIGTDGGGLNRFNPENGKCRRYQSDASIPGSLSHNRVFKVFVDRRGTIWIATFGGGLNRYVPETDSFKVYKNNPGDENSLAYDYVVTIFEDGDGYLWLGTDGLGLEKFDYAHDRFIHYSDEQGLPNKTIYAILEDGHGNLWMSHNMGISRFDRKTRTFKSYSEQDGLQSNEFNGNAGFKSMRSGEMFFGGINGFNAFYPDAINDNPYPPTIAITSLQLFNKPVPVGKQFNGRLILKQALADTEEIVLSYQDKTIGFEYTGLNFISPEKNQYAYIMEGFDKSWNLVGNRRFASYAGLPPGKYIFRVKGSNNDGVWNEQGVSLRIRIKPPFWQTWWFIIVTTLILGLAVFGLYSRRIRALEKAKKELERLVALRTQELRDTSLKDPLTGLRNRRFISEVLDREIAVFIKKKRFLMKTNQNRRKTSDNLVYGILMIDIDYFKSINDQFGHDIGDRWLVEFARVIRKCIRIDDETIRYGGEEFLVILKNTDPAMLDTLVQKIKGELDKIDILPDKELKYTCSIGVVSFPFCAGNPDLFSFENTIKMADLGLYYAKNNGRNMWIRISAVENVLPAPEDLAQLTTSLEFGLKKGLVTIKALC